MRCHRQFEVLLPNCTAHSAAVAKQRGLRYEYSNPNQLSKRIADTVRNLQTKEATQLDGGKGMTYYTSKFALTTRKNSDNTTLYTFDFSARVALD